MIGERKKVLLLVVLALICLSSAFFLYRHTLISKTLVYSTITFSSDKEQLVKSGSVLNGTGIPNAKVIIYITPSNTKEQLATDDKGIWSYQLSNNLRSGNYRLTIELFDRLDKLVSIKSYQIKIQSPSLFDLFKVSKASAQEQLTPEEDKWVVQMRMLGIWPAKENDEFVLYSEQEWDKRYCPHPCAKITRQPSVGEQIASQFKGKNKNITQELIKKLQVKGYAPLPVLTQYIPELHNEQVQKDYGITKAFAVNAKREISEQDLRDILNEVFKEGLDYQLKGGDVGTFIDLVGIRTVLNVFTDPSHHRLEYLSQDEAAEFIFGLMIIYDPGGRMVTKLGKETIKLTSGALDELRLFRLAINKGEAIPVRVVQERVISDQRVYFGNYAWRSPLAIMPAKIEQSGANTAGKIASLFNSGKAYSLDQQVTRPLMEDLIEKVSYFVPEAGQNKARIMETIDNNWVVVLPDEVFHVLKATEIRAAGFTDNRLVVIRQSYSNNPGLILHEFGHVIKHALFRRGGVYYNYSQTQKDIYQATMSMIEEVMVDKVIEVYYGYPSVYKALYPQLHNSILELVDYIIRRSGNYDLTITDFMRFSLTGDDGFLMQKILTKISPEEFIHIVDRRIDTQRLLSIYYDYYDRQQLALNVIQAARPSSSGKVIPGISALGTVGVIWTLIGTSHQPVIDETKPYNVFYVPFTPDQDINLLKEIVPQPNQVKIIKVNGNFAPGGSLEVSVIASEDGSYVVESKQFRIRLILHPIKTTKSDTLLEVLAQDSDVSVELPILDDQTDCQQYCSIQIPVTISPGEYELIAEVIDNENNNTLASDVFPITIQKPKKRVIKVSFNEVDVPIVDGQAIFKNHLPGQIGQPSSFKVPIVITLSDETKYLAYDFNYQPRVQPETTSEPSAVGNISCPSSYNQCGGTLGLEHENPQHLFKVFPPCESAGRNEYTHQDLYFIPGNCGVPSIEEDSSCNIVYEDPNQPVGTNCTYKYNTKPGEDCEINAVFVPSTCNL